MKRILISILMIALLAGAAFAITYDADYFLDQIGYYNANSKTQNPIYLFMDEVGGILEGETGTGKFWFVDSGATGNADGTKWVNASLTLDAAINLSSADGGVDRGDRIYIAQGHNEALIATDGVDVDVNGVTIIGLGNGSLKPTFDYDHADGEFVIGADNVTIKNLRFRVSANAVKLAIDIEDDVDYASILGCEFGYAETATDEFTECIVFNDASNYGKVIGCYFDAGSQAAQSAIMFDEDTHGTIVKNNIFVGTWATAIFEGATTLSSSLIIIDNDIFGIGSADTFNLYANSTGIVARNTVVMTATSAANALDIGDCMNIENHLIADDDSGGAKAEIITNAFTSVTATADD